MGDRPDYDELLAYAQKLENRVAMLEETLNQYQYEGARVKTSFLSNISHEIRTPMNAIIGFSHLLGEDEVDEQQREAYINHITRNSNSLLNMMDNLIDLTLIETGNLELKTEPVEIYAVLRELYNRYNLDRYRVNKERVALLLNVRDSLKNVRIIVDRDRFYRAFGCLLENAINHTQKGVIEIGASFVNQHTMMFSVKDSGDMLLQEAARKIFENSGKKGEGLATDVVTIGYRLAKGLIEAMDGEIMVDNSPFKGTSVGFAMPVKTIGPGLEPDGHVVKVRMEEPQGD
ncbi:MAG: hypothetical protein CSA96_08090 [Bacteroidetes bacterium]|nr:MAG: hypothetical protein CSA96_08090 [Bacteroidota bacterium]